MKTFFMVVTLAMLGALAWDKFTAPPGRSFFDFLLSRALEQTANPQPSPIVDTQIKGLPQIQELAELATFSYRSTAVTNAEQKTDIPLIGAQTTAKITYQTTATIKVGVDLKQVTPTSLVSTPEAITVTLPPAQILSITPDENKSKVIASMEIRPEPGLQQTARQDAVKQFRTEVCESDTLKKAEQLAGITIKNLLAAANPNRVINVTIQERKEACQ